MVRRRGYCSRLEGFCCPLLASRRLHLPKRLITSVPPLMPCSPDGRSGKLSVTISLDSCCPGSATCTLVELAALVPGAERQRLHHCMQAAPWDAEAVKVQRLKRWQAHPYLGPHPEGVLLLDETGDPKRGQRMVLAAQQ
jgi:hypothetical protein